MIKMDQSEQKFFRMCRYKEIDGKILVCFINDYVNSDEAEGLMIALAKKHVAVDVHPEGNLWIDKDMFYENKDSYYAGRRRCIKSETPGSTDDQVMAQIKYLHDEFGVAIDIIYNLYLMMPTELYDGLVTAIEEIEDEMSII